MYHERMYVFQYIIKHFMVWFFLPFILVACYVCYVLCIFENQNAIRHFIYLDTQNFGRTLRCLMAKSRRRQNIRDLRPFISNFHLEPRFNGSAWISVSSNPIQFNPIATRHYYLFILWRRKEESATSCLCCCLCENSNQTTNERMSWEAPNANTSTFNWYIWWNERIVRYFNWLKFVVVVVLFLTCLNVCPTNKLVALRWMYNKVFFLHWISSYDIGHYLKCYFECVYVLVCVCVCIHNECEPASATIN